MNEIGTWAFIVSIISIILTGITAGFSVFAYAKVVGMEKSTHQVQWVPLDQELKSTEELEKAMYKSYGYEAEENDSII